MHPRRRWKLTFAVFSRTVRKSVMRWIVDTKKGSHPVHNSCFDVSRGAVLIALVVVSALPCVAATANYEREIRPLLKQYCLGCHSTEKHKGDLDLERFKSQGEILKHSKVWEDVVEKLSLSEMPPKEKPQPTAAERERVISFANTALDKL